MIDLNVKSDLVVPLNPSVREDSVRLKDEFSDKSLLPRERLIKYGPASLRTDELLAIIIKTGTRGHNVLEVSKNILRAYPSLKYLAKAMPSDLMRIHGVGKVKAIELAAAIELGKRIADSSDEDDSTPLRKPELIAAKIRRIKINDDTESFFVFPLNKKLRVSGPVTEISKGTLDASIVHPRDVFRAALKWSASAIIVAHNHPSGDVTPSKEDIAVTKKLVQAGHIMNIPVLDHVIVGDASEKINPDCEYERQNAESAAGFLSLKRQNPELFK